MKEHIKQEIYEKLGKMEQRNGAKIASLTDRIALPITVTSQDRANTEKSGQMRCRRC